MDSIRQEAMRAIEAASEFKNQISRLNESLEDLRTENRFYYELMADRVDFMTQLQQIEGYLEETSREVTKHIELLEESIA